MSDDKTQREGEVPEADPVADDAVISELEEQFDDSEAAEDETGEAASKKKTDDKPKAVVRKTAKAPVKKTAPTKKRSESAHEEHDPYRAKNPAQFAKQSAGELKKVVWPTWNELTTLFAVVLVFVLFMVLYVSVLDYGFAQALLKLFGGTQ